MKQLKDYLIINNQSYFISTADTFDKSYETMIFEVDSNGSINWREKYAQLHKTESDAIKEHSRILKAIKSKTLKLWEHYYD